MTIAKRNSKGNYLEDELSGLNQRAEALKNKLVAWIQVIAVLSIFALGTEPGFIIVLIIVGIIFGRSTDYDDWLERA